MSETRKPAPSEWGAEELCKLEQPAYCQHLIIGGRQCQLLFGHLGPCEFSALGAPLQPGASQPEQDVVSRETETFTNQRLFDLVRYKRSELHTDGLISDDEYAVLAQEHAAVARLEDYDAIKRKVAHIPTLLERMARLVVMQTLLVLAQCEGDGVNESGALAARIEANLLTPEKLQQLREAVERP